MLQELSTDAAPNLARAHDEHGSPRRRRRGRGRRGVRARARSSSAPPRRRRAQRSRRTRAAPPRPRGTRSRAPAIPWPTRDSIAHAPARPLAVGIGERLHLEPERHPHEADRQRHDEQAAERGMGRSSRPRPSSPWCARHSPSARRRREHADDGVHGSLRCVPRTRERADPGRRTDRGPPAPPRPDLARSPHTAQVTTPPSARALPAV